MAVIISDFMFMQEDLRKADGMLAWCDSIREAQVIKIEQQENKLTEKDNIIWGLDKIVEFSNEKFDAAEKHNKALKFQRNILIVASGILTFLLIIVAL